MKCPEHIFRGLVADAVHFRENAVAVAHIHACAQQTDCYTGLKPFRPFVGYIQRTGHLVAVFCAEAACRECHVLHHFGIDETQSFLLPRADEQRAVHLYAVHIHFVLVERTAAHIVLRAQFVVLVDAGKRNQYTLNRPARCVRHQSCRACVYLVHRARRPADTAHFHFLYPLFVRRQRHIDIQHILPPHNPLPRRHVSNHRKHQFQTVCFRFPTFIFQLSTFNFPLSTFHYYRIIAVLIGGRAVDDAVLVLCRDVHQLYAAVVAIRNVPVHAHRACIQTRRSQTNESNEQHI